MFFCDYHSVSLCVGCMEHSDSEPDFKLQAVDPVHDGFSDEPFETSSEEHDSGLGERY